MKLSAFAGFLEELDVRDIIHSRNSSRSDLANLDELMASIQTNGLLQPIVVRPSARSFEVVAGNRRFEACKRLGLNRICCHVVDMDEKEAYEVSLIENIERRTLDPVEEAEAFKRYVDDYGYGSTSELGRKIGRSEQYVSARISLLRLPADLREKVTRRVVTPSHVRELVGLDEEQQRSITHIIVDQGISSRDVRRIVRGVKNGEEHHEPYFLRPGYDSSLARRGAITRSYSRCIASLRISMMRFDEALEQIDEFEWGAREMLMAHRRYLHDQIDNLLRLKRKIERDGWPA